MVGQTAGSVNENGKKRAGGSRMVSMFGEEVG